MEGTDKATNDLRHIMQQLRIERIPSTWEKNYTVNLQSASLWVSDFAKRVKQLGNNNTTTGSNLVFTEEGKRRKRKRALDALVNQTSKYPYTNELYFFKNDKMIKNSLLRQIKLCQRACGPCLAGWFVPTRSICCCYETG